MRNNGMINLETTNYKLRKIRDNDNTVFINWANDINAKKNMDWQIKNKESTMEWIQLINNKICSDQYYGWGIYIERECIGFIEVELSDKIGEIRYIIGSKYWEKDCLLEIIKVIKEYLFRIVKVKSIIFMPNNMNGDSATIKKIGFKKDSKEDYLLYNTRRYMRDYDVSSLFFELPLYSKVEVVWDDFVNKDKHYPDEFQALVDFINGKDRPYGKCPTCKRDYLWKLTKQEPQYKPEEIKTTWDECHNNLDEDIKITFERFALKERINESIAEIEYFDKSLVCETCKNRYKFSYKVSNKIEESGQMFLQKIGQFPTITEFSKLNENVYKKLLKEIQSEDEWKKAHYLHIDGYSIAAYTYLRRVLEKFIQYKFKSEESNLECTYEQFKSKRMNEKLEILKEYLPDYLFTNQQIYGVISAGIHSLSEKECAEYFSTVENVIEFILINEEEKKKKKDLENNSIKDLNRVANVIKHSLNQN